MKKTFILLAILAISTLAFGQRIIEGEMQVNAGLGFNSGNWSTPVYVSMDYGVHPDITVGGLVSYATHTYKYATFENTGRWISLAARGDYHFNTILEIPDMWDVYAGATLAYNSITYKHDWNEGYNNYDNSGLGFGLQIGGRYFFNESWAINLEFGGGSIASGGKLGVSYRF